MFERIFTEQVPEGRLLLRIFSRHPVYQFRIPLHLFHLAIGIDEKLEVGADHLAQPGSHRIPGILGGVLGGIGAEHLAIPDRDLHRQAFKFELQLLAAVVEFPDQGEIEVLGHFLHLFHRLRLIGRCRFRSLG